MPSTAQATRSPIIVHRRTDCRVTSPLGSRPALATSTAARWCLSLAPSNNPRCRYSGRVLARSSSRRRGSRFWLSQMRRTTTRVKPAPGRCRLLCQNEYVRVVPEDLRLASVLETVLYYASDQQDEMERFYEDVLGLESLGLGRWSLAFRLGQGVVLLFDRERSSTQDEPPPHGASGSIHAAFLAAPDEYDAWKERLTDRGVTLIDEIAWDSGVRSCYFNDPAGNLLEIAERDLWTR
jgi:catechol 2,3-dioxygenase-like lactoylglutathione lyase family enzyme